LARFASYSDFAVFTKHNFNTNINLNICVNLDFNISSGSSAFILNIVHVDILLGIFGDFNTGEFGIS